MHKAALVCWALLLALPAQAQDKPDNTGKDEIVVTSSLTPIARSETVNALSVFSAEDLQMQGPIPLSDMLRDIPGLAVNRSGPAGQLTQVRLRGSEANQVLVMLNGFPVNDPYTGGHDFAFDGTGLLSGVEVLRGEQSALWGAGALGGVINLQNGPADHDISSAQFEAGSLNYQSGQIRFSQRSDKRAIWGGADVARSDGVDVSGLNGETDGYARRDLQLGLQTRIAPNTHLDLFATTGHGRSDYDSDTDFDGRLDETSDKMIRDTTRVQARLMHMPDTGISWQLGAQFQQQKTHISDTISIGRDTYIFAQAHRKWTQGKTSQQLTVRGEWQHLDFDVDGGPGALQNQRQSEDQLSVAAEYRLVTDPLVLQVSARQDENRLFANAHAVQAGISLRTPVQGGRLRFRYGEGVKNPGFYELYGYFPSTFVGNPDLQPEQQRGVEAGWEQDWGNAQISLSVFSSRLHNEIYTDFAQYPATARNHQGSSLREGVELAGNWQLTPTLYLTGAVSHVRAGNEQNQPELRRPEWFTSFGLDWRPGQWVISADLNGQSSLRDTDFATFTTVDLPGFALMRARIAYQFTSHMTVYVRGENLLDRNAVQVVGYAPQPRTLYGGLSLDF